MSKNTISIFNPRFLLLAYGLFCLTFKPIRAQSSDNMILMRLFDVPIETIAMSPNQEVLAVGGRTPEIVLLNLTTGQRNELQGHKDYINALQFTPDGNELYAASDDGTISHWRPDEQKLLNKTIAHDKWTTGLCLQNNQLFSAGWDGSIKRWSAALVLEQVLFKDATKRFYNLALSPNGQYLATLASDGFLYLIDAQNGKVRKQWDTGKRHKRQIGFSADSRSVFVGDLLYQTDNHQPKNMLQMDMPYGAAMSPGQMHHLVAGRDGILSIYDLHANQLATNLSTGRKEVFTILEFSSADEFVAGGSKSGFIFVWNYLQYKAKARTDESLFDRLQTEDLFKPRTEFESEFDFYHRQLQSNALLSVRLDEWKLEEKKKQEDAVRWQEEKIRNSLKQTTLKITDIGKYDADNETWPVWINHRAMRLEMSKSDARTFKKNYKMAMISALVQLQEDATTPDTFNIVVQHPTSGNKYPVGNQRAPLYADGGWQNHEFATLGEGVPELSVSVELMEASGNKALDATESAVLQVKIDNTGGADAQNLQLSVACDNQHINHTKNTVIKSIPANNSATAVIRIEADKELTAGTAKFTINFNEKSGFQPPVTTVGIKTQAYQTPQLVVVETGIRDKNNNNAEIEINEIIEVSCLVQNKGGGMARNVESEVLIGNPNVVLITPQLQNQKLGNLISGESRILHFSFVVNANYRGEKLLPVSVRLTEAEQEYGGDYNLGLALNQTHLIANDIIIDAETDNEAVNPVSLISDVDKNIPVNPANRFNTYVLVIGNEDYNSYQTNLHREVNVDYAINDARIFAQYANLTLGIPEKNIKTLYNATSAEMQRGIEWLVKLAQLAEGKAELMLYYSGHGLPHEETRDAYIIPVDANALTLNNALKLNQLYEQLATHPALRTTVILDACFSGGGRTNGLLAQKGMVIKPKSAVLNHNMVVFASSTGTESSGVYREKQHGYFTYFLLKKIQESKGDITYGELSDYLRQHVARETVLLSEKIQTPSTQASEIVKDTWHLWKLNGR